MAAKIDDGYELLLKTYRNISMKCALSCVPTQIEAKPRRGEVLCTEYCIAHEMKQMRKSVLSKLTQTRKK